MRVKCMLNSCQIRADPDFLICYTSLRTNACHERGCTFSFCKRATCTTHSEVSFVWKLFFCATKLLASNRTALVRSWSNRGRVRQYLNATFPHVLVSYFCDICFQSRDEDWIFFVFQVPSLVFLWARRFRKAVTAHGMKKALASRSQNISFRGVVNWARRSRFLDIGWERQPCP